MTQNTISEFETPKSIVDYREMYPDATREQLVKVQSDALAEFRREALSGIAMGASFSVADEVVKSIGRNNG
jgi:hypothetical protein